MGKFSSGVATVMVMWSRAAYAQAQDAPPALQGNQVLMVVTSSRFSLTPLTPRLNSSELQTNAPATGHIE